DIVTERLAAGAGRVRLVGEPACPSGFPELEREWIRYESALNAVLGPFPTTLLCTYPASRLDPSIVANARRTHSVVAGDGEPANDDFEEPAHLLRRMVPELAPPPPEAAVLRAPDDL